MIKSDKSIWNEKGNFGIRDGLSRKVSNEFSLNLLHFFN